MWIHYEGSNVTGVGAWLHYEGSNVAVVLE